MRTLPSLLLLLVPFFPCALPQAPSYDPHAPILITGNALLLLPDSVAGNGVRSGSGTADDPFVISGWEIDARTQDGILIANVDAHLVIRGNRIHSGLQSEGRYFYSGVVLQNVLNATIQGNRFDDDFDGVFLRERVNVRIAENEIDGSRNAGVEAWDSNVTLVSNEIRRTDGVGILWNAALSGRETLSARGNRVEDAGQGVVVRGGRDHVFEGNRVSRAAGQAVLLAAPGLVSDNLLEASGTGLDVEGKASVQGNVLARNGHGLVVQGETRVSGNALHDNDFGILVAGGAPTVRQNDVFDNRGAGIQAPPGSLAIGNWWGAEDGPSGEGPGHGDRVFGARFGPFSAEPFTIAGRNRGNGVSLGYGPAPTSGAELDPDAALLLVVAAVALALAVLHVRGRKRGP